MQSFIVQGMGPYKGIYIAYPFSLSNLSSMFPLQPQADWYLITVQYTASILKVLHFPYLKFQQIFCKYMFHPYCMHENTLLNSYLRLKKLCILLP